jgi:hypothetical protein
MGGMSEERKKSGAGCAIASEVLAVLLVLYVLGIGPAALVAKNYPATDVGLQIFYFPLLTLGWAFRPIGSAIEWYTNLWGA